MFAPGFVRCTGKPGGGAAENPSNTEKGGGFTKARIWQEYSGKSRNLREGRFDETNPGNRIPGKE